MLMLFDSFQRNDAVMAALQAQPVEDFPHQVLGLDGSHAGHMRDYVLRGGAFVGCSVILPKRAPTVGAARLAWQRQANALIAAHPGAQAICIFHATMPANRREPSCLLINPTPAALVQALGVQATEAERAALERALVPRTRGTGRTRDAELMAVFADIADRVAAAPAAYPGGADLVQLLEPPTPADDAHDDADAADAEEERQYQAALAASLAEPQPEEAPRPIKRTWEDVLRAEGEPLQESDPACVACLQCRASVCIMPCGHQVLCDGCTRAWLGAGSGKCPVCKADYEGVVRPFLSGRSEEKK